MPFPDTEPPHGITASDIRIRLRNTQVDGQLTKLSAALYIGESIALFSPDDSTLKTAQDVLRQRIVYRLYRDLAPAIMGVRLLVKNLSNGSKALDDALEEIDRELAAIARSSNHLLTPGPVEIIESKEVE